MKKFFYKFLVVILAVGMLTPTWVTKMWMPTKALAATHGSGGGGSVVNGTPSDYMTVDPLTIISTNSGDIRHSDGIKITIHSSVAAPGLQFDTTVDSVSAVPSSNLDLGSGNGTGIMVSPSSSQIIIPVTTINAPAGESVTITGIKIHATSSGLTSNFRGHANIKADTHGGDFNGSIFQVDAQFPKITGTKITVTGNHGVPPYTFIQNDTARVCWDNTATGDDNSDIAEVDVNFTEFGGSTISATNVSNVWCAEYSINQDMTVSGVQAKVIATDTAGNSTSQNTNFFNIDTKAPIITITRDPNIDLSAGAYQISINFGDAVSGKQYQINGGAWIPYISAFTETIDGNYVINAHGMDAAGNLGVSTTSFTINSTPPPAPLNLTAVAGNGEVSLAWDAVAGATRYEVSYKKVSDPNYGAPISVSGTTTRIIGLTNGISYNFQIVAIGSNGIKGVPAIATASPSAPRVVTTLAVIPAPQQPVALQTPTPIITPATPSTPAPVEQGQIKGTETNDTSESEKINWTPWIILFILIILAGAATGGYFYWFGREDEEEIVTKEVVEKNRKSAKATKSGPKKSKRW